MKFKYVKADKPRELTVEEGVGYGALDAKTIARAIPCQEACPAKTNVPGYIEQIMLGNDDEAYRINQEDNVFPGVLGRICTRVCEDRCRHLWTNVEGAVQICHLKRYAADHIREQQTPPKPYFGPSGKTVAVVGGGPAGLAAARELSRLGHRVCIYERGPALGGMLVEGIPAFRLPRDIVTAETEMIVKGGVEVRLSESVDAARIEAMTGSYDAVLVAVGTTLSNEVKLDGHATVEETGLTFMKRFNNGELTSVSGDVVVIGGGFTAVDCARSARRIASAKATVTIAYRRTEASMAADGSELSAMMEEGVRIRTLLTPKAVETNADGKSVVVFDRNTADPAAPGEKPRIRPVPGREVRLPCDTLIFAVGQAKDNSLLPNTATRIDEFRTANPKIFTAGDFAGTSADVITAVASGKTAAGVIDEALTGKRRLTSGVKVERLEQDGDTGRTRDHDIQWPLPMPVSNPDAREAREAEVELGFTDPIAETACSRCYLCHYKFEIDQDICIHCDWCIQAAPRNCIKKVSRIHRDEDGLPVRYQETDRSREATFIYIDTDECIRCGKCLRVCPVEAISMKKLTRVTTLKKHA